MSKVIFNKYQLANSEFILVIIDLSGKSLSISHCNDNTVFSSKEVSLEQLKYDITKTGVLSYRCYGKDSLWYASVEYNNKIVKVSIETNKNIEIKSVIVNNNAGGEPVTIVNNKVNKGTQQIVVDEFDYLYPYVIQVDETYIYSYKFGSSNSNKFIEYDITDINDLYNNQVLIASVKVTGREVEQITDNACISYLDYHANYFEDQYVKQIRLIVRNQLDLGYEPKFELYTQSSGETKKVNCTITKTPYDEERTLLVLTIPNGILTRNTEIILSSSNMTEEINFIEFRTDKIARPK